MDNLLGLYEKAFPQTMPWPDKFRHAQELGFQFIELSVDESDQRLARLNWSSAESQNFRDMAEKAGLPFQTMCFSGHRRFPFGSHDPLIRQKALQLMEKAILLARQLGIRTIQLAGYDVYYETGDEQTRQWFVDGLRQSALLAAHYQVMLALEIMDTPFLNSISKYMDYDALVSSPWLTVYPDIGNLTAWNLDVCEQLTLGRSRLTAIHIKETRKVSATDSGQFRDVLFGEGDVDFVRIFSHLAALSYTGPLILEMWGDKLPDPVAEIRRSRDFIRERMTVGGLL